MKCSCGLEPIYFRRYSGQYFCKSCFNTYFETKVYETINKHNLIEPGEKVAVGVSGGKDSTVLLHILNKLSKQLKIELYPITIDEGITGYKENGLSAVRKNCEALGLPLEIVSLEENTGFRLDKLASKGDKKPCTYCGVFRRKFLNQWSLEIGADKLATGHNLDDEAQAVMMNYISGDIDRLQRLNGKIQNHYLVRRVKPLSKLPEKEIMIYALLNKLEISQDECPYARENHRTKVRDFLNELEVERPGVKFSIINGQNRLQNTQSGGRAKVQRCEVCEHATTRNKCRACELTEEIKIKMSGEI